MPTVFHNKTWLLSSASVNTCKILHYVVISVICLLCFLTSACYSIFIHNKERNAVIVLLPKPPLENIGHLKVNRHGKASWLAGNKYALLRSMSYCSSPSFIHLQCSLKRAVGFIFFKISSMGPVWTSSDLWED